MKSFLLIFLYLLSTLAFGNDETARLQALLDLDRFEAYTEAWAGTMRGRDKAAIADAIHKFGPADFAAMNLDPAKLKNAQHYDGLILEILTKRHPELGATAAQVEWGYNFFKNKLNDAYLVNPASLRETSPVPLSDEARRPTPLDMSPLNSQEVLLDVDAYASDRTTRAVFWEASDSGRQIEMFLGSASKFQDEMTRRGATVIAEVGTKARNYNPIFLIRNPGEAGYHYAITEISGADRLEHFRLQSSLIRWNRGNGKLAPPPPFSVVGSAAQTLADEERALTQVLRSVPRADHVVIGQKGAFERTFGSLGKIRALMGLRTADPAGSGALFTEKELKIIAKASETSELTQFVMKNASDIDKLYQKATPLLTKHNLTVPQNTVFNYNRGTYEMSDYIMQGADGKPQRWRIFSNVWGDEVLPIARSLKATNYNTVNYIGTAGAFQGTDLKVGDLVIPNAAANIQGEISPIARSADLTPPGARYVDAVINVQSPFEETTSWLAKARNVSQVVEVETGYLRSVFDAPTDRLNVQLLISDVVGSTDETLATASSSARRKAQINALSVVINNAGVAAPATVPASGNQIQQWIQEIVPSRDLTSQVQIAREAQLRGITTRPELEAFIKTQKSFTTAKVESLLRGADQRLASFVTKLKNIATTPIVSFAAQLFDGRFNPASGGVGVHFTAPAADQIKINQVLAEMKAADKDFAKFLNVSISNDVPEHFRSPIRADQTPSIRSIHQNGLVEFGGLAFTENSSGALKYVRVADVSTSPVPEPPRIEGQACSTNYSAALDLLLR